MQFLREHDSPLRPVCVIAVECREGERCLGRPCPLRGEEDRDHQDPWRRHAAR